MTLRFSLRGLLLLTVAVAALCYWRDRPRRVAAEFTAAIEAGDLHHAGSMFCQDDDYCTDESDVLWFWTDLSVEPTGQSASDWLRGRYPLAVRGRYEGREGHALTAVAAMQGVVGVEAFWGAEE